MLTPKQLRAHEFETSGRNAYKAVDVDNFLDEVYESYETMFRENGELVKKLNLVADKLASYKNDEDNIRNALLTAERMKESMVAEAQEQIKGILDEANAKAEEIIANANEKAEESLKLAQSNATKLLAKAQEIYDDQVNTIKEEADKEEAYLLHIKEESAKVRADLIDTYQRQIQMLEFTPDFSEEIKAAHAKVEEEEKEEAEELEENVELEKESAELEEESVEEAVEKYASSSASEEDSEFIETDDYEDIDSGADLFADDNEEGVLDNGEVSLF